MPDPKEVDYRALNYLEFLKLRTELIYTDIEALVKGKAI
jgi:hypothetical protein